MSKNKLLATSLLATVSLTTLAYPSFAATDKFVKGGDYGFDNAGEHDKDDDDEDIQDDTVRLDFAQTDLDEAPDVTGRDVNKAPACGITIPADTDLAFEKTDNVAQSKKSKRRYKVSLAEDIPIEFTNLNLVDTIYLKFSPTIINYKGDNPENASEKRHVKGNWSLGDLGDDALGAVIQIENDDDKKYEFLNWKNNSKGITVRITKSDNHPFREDQIVTIESDDMFFEFDLKQDDIKGGILSGWEDSKYQMQIAAYCSYEDPLKTYKDLHKLTRY